MNALNVFIALSLCIVVALTVSGYFRTTFLPLDEFLSSVIIDDANYNLVPARNLLRGHGYSFDKIHRTNGVQPLWALWSIVLVGLCPEPESAMRLLVLSGAICWIIAGLLLFAAFRPVNAGVALLSSTAFLLAGFTQRLAMLGMENGITAIFLALLVSFGILRLSPDRALCLTDYLALGTIAGFLSLCRVEMIILGTLFVGATLLGAFEAPRQPRLYWVQSFAVGLPILVVFGAYVLTNLVYFGGLVPVSGAAKSYYNSQYLAAGWPHGSLVNNLLFHLRYPLDLATFSFSEGVSRWLWQNSIISLPREGVFQTLVATTGIGAVLCLWRSKPKCFSPRTIYWTLLSVFVLLHLTMLALLNPYFTLYGIWYFTPEIMLPIVVMSLSLLGLAELAATVLRRVSPRFSAPNFAQWSIALLSAVLIAVNAPLAFGLRYVETRASMMLAFKRSGEWLSTRLAGTQRIATLSSGVVNVYADRHFVYNLDGLMNDYEYLEDFLSEKRLSDYIDRERITYFADYAPLAQFKHGLPWGGIAPLPRLQLLKWWIIPDGTNAYGIWRILPPGEGRQPDGSGSGPVDRLSQIQRQALCFDGYQVVADRDLQAHQQEHPGDLVVTSVQRALDGPLDHIAMTKEQFRSLNLQPAELDIAQPMAVTFGESIRLIGFEAQSWRVARGQRFVFTRYWQALTSATSDQLSIDLYVRLESPGWFWAKDAGAHGTFPVSKWEAGDTIVETYALPVPPDTPPGSYPVHMGIWDPVKGWLASDQPTDSMRPGMILVGHLEIR